MLSHRHTLRALSVALFTMALGITCTYDEHVAPTAARPPAAPSAALVASSPAPVLIGAGDIARCDRTNDEATAKLLGAYPDATVFTAGDNVYVNGSISDFTSCYAPSTTWGQFKARTRPAVGNIEYKTTGAAGYFKYFGAAAAGDSAKYYYSYNLGSTWHIIVLNDNISMAAGSPQELWLKNDLAANPQKCTLAYWHHPRFTSSGTNKLASVLPLWNDLYSYSADVVVNGNYFNYERFAPQTPAGVADAVKGLREFIVGTGGQNLQKPGTAVANSQVRNGTTYGVLKLTLNYSSYSWQFLPIAGQTFTDSGSTACHRTAVASVSVSPATTSVLVGGTVQLSATAKDANGNTLTGRGITWQSADTTIAKVDNTGLVTGKAQGGPVAITATSEGQSGTAAITVANIPVSSVAVTPATASVLVNGTVQLTATPKDSAGNPLSGRTITWAASNAAATVSTSGLVRGVTAGTDTITATSGGKTGLATIAVMDTTAVLVGAGDIAACPNDVDIVDGDDSTATILDTIPGTVFTLGDNAYENGTATEFTNCYNPSWGRHKARTRPTPGNHEYVTAGAAGYFGYFGAAASDPTKGYYSYDLGAWHVVVLNNYVAQNIGSAQEQWLRADLAASTKQCTIAMWHEPLFSSGPKGGTPGSLALWQALYAYGAEIVLNGHEHNYQRFAPQRPDGTPDPAFGIREFVVGTGGESHDGVHSLATTEAQIGGEYGVIKLTLQPGGYTWQFIPQAGKTTTDQGSGTCHAAPPPLANPGGPYAGDGSVQFNGSASSSPQGNMPLAYAWDFGDGTTGSGATPVHTYAGYNTYTVTLVVTDSKGNQSLPATTTATSGNQPPVVNAGPDWIIPPGGTVSLSATFTDNASDNPWKYTITWGDGSPADTGTTSASPITFSHSYQGQGQYPLLVSVTDVRGATGSGAATVNVSDPSGSQVLIGAGDIARCDRASDSVTALIIDTIPGTVFTAGNATLGTSSSPPDFINCYDQSPHWGRFKARTRPAPGNAEAWSPGLSTYYRYWGAAAGDSAKGYYSYDLGSWHIIVLNSTGADNVQMGVGSPQETWLQQDLASNTKLCTLAIWNIPRYNSAAGSPVVYDAVKPFWNDLYAAGAEVVLNAFDEVYERFAPQTPDGVADPDHGIRQFTVGTGGMGTNTLFSRQPNSEVFSSQGYGVIKLTLLATGYTWQFIPAGSNTFTDSGTGSCH